MRARFIPLAGLGLLLAALPANGMAQLPSWMPPNPGINMQVPGEAQLMQPLVVSLPRLDQVKVRENLVYTDADNDAVRVDVYEPIDARPDEVRPAVIYIHGGTGVQYRPKDWGGFQARGRLVAASGLVGIVFTHRLGYPDTNLRRGARDVASAIAFVRANAKTLGVDAERICLVFYSAGGPLMSPHIDDAPEYIRCVVGVVNALSASGDK